MQMARYMYIRVTLPKSHACEKVHLAPLGLERSRNDDFMTPEAQKVEKKLSQIGSYGHFTV